jgi:hypothetical protein
VCALRADARSGAPKSRPPLEARRSGERVTEPGAQERPARAGPVRRGGAPFTNNAGERGRVANMRAGLGESTRRVAGPFGAAMRLGVPPSTRASIMALGIDKCRFE